MNEYTSFPPQQLSFSSKGKAWRRQHLDWADTKSFFNYGSVRNSSIHKKINYDLVSGKIHMEDIAKILNPEGFQADFIPEKIQHYAIINSKLNVLRGEEAKRLFDYRVIITNPTSISEIEAKKKDEVFEAVMNLIREQNQDLQAQIQAEQQQQQFAQQQQMQQQQLAEQGQQIPQEEGIPAIQQQAPQEQEQMQPQQMPQSQPTEAEQKFNQKLERINQYYTYEYQDIREMRANAILHHYIKEYNMGNMFNQGFMDAMICGEEIYQCEIIGGEPTIKRINPLKLSIFRSGYSNNIEDADVVIMEDYWSLGRVYDTFYDSLTEKDRKYLEKYSNTGEIATTDSMQNIDERAGLVRKTMISDVIVNDDFYFNPFSDNTELSSLSPFDGEGNVRVLRMYWKSRRKIKKVTSFDPITGEEVSTFYGEDYHADESKGETEETFWINQAWEGTKIGKEVYINIRPCPVQYNRITNPSRCHFGIVGSVYTLNEGRPFSLVDMMKPYAYLYDIIHNRMEKFISRDWGFLVNIDFAKMPRGWTFDKYMYYAKNLGVLVQDSFNEGNIGAATGKLAGALNNNTNGGFNASSYEAVKGYMEYLEYISNKLGEIVGISKQREGQISNRETVGGVERSTLQSSYITEYLFTIHDDVKKRALECFLETAKIAMKGKSKKFQYITDDFASKLVEIDGDEFAESDYGLVVDSSETSQKLAQNLEMLAQAALQNQVLSFSTIMKLYGSSSLAEKQRMVERDEQERLAQAQQAQQEQVQAQQEATQAQMQIAQQQLQQQDIINQRDNDTKIQVAQIQAQSKIQATAMQIDGSDDGGEEMQLRLAELDEQKRQFDIKARQTDQKLSDAKLNNEQNLRFNERKLNQDRVLKEKQIGVQRMAKKTNK